jgi:hypothetical protein
VNPTVECPGCKRKIALGRAKCTFCGAALPASEAAPAAKGPKKYELGDLVQVSIAAGDPGRGPLRLRVKGTKLAFPQACACCQERSEVARPLSAINARTLPGEILSDTYKIETRTYTFSIPYCSHCDGHGQNTPRKPTCAAGGAAVALDFQLEKREFTFTFLNRAFGLAVLEANKGKR